MWMVAFADAGDLVAGAVGDPGVTTPTWVSRDGRRRLQPAGDGPSLVLGGDRVVVGVRTSEPFALWRMEPE